MQLVVEAIFEPTFLDCSHGFRPNKGCHTALKTVRSDYKSINWVIEADIEKCFDKIDHNVLLRILSERIQCEKTLALFKSALIAGYIDLGKFVKSKEGTPQGSVVSPVLCNIYLHKLDLLMVSLMKEHNKGQKRKATKEYRTILMRRMRAIKAGNMEKAAAIQKLLQQTRASDMMDPNVVRVRYLRHADDFIIGISGPKALAVKIHDQVKSFL